MKRWALATLLAHACAVEEQRTPRGPSTQRPATEATTTNPTAPGQTSHTGEIDIVDLTVVTNPRNVLSVWVSWRTESPTSSEVQFVDPMGQTWRVTDDALTTDHEVFVIGLRGDTDYAMTAISQGDGLKGETAFSWSTDTAPFPVVPGTLVDHDRALSQPGWTLMDLYVDGDTPTTIGMFDEEGFPVWYYQFPDSTGGQGMDLDLTDSGVLIGGAVPSGVMPREVSLDGTEIWWGPEQPGFNSDGYFHHHAEKLANGNILTLEKAFVGDTRGDLVIERDASWNEVWSWNTFDWLPPDWGTDWTHCNWAALDGDLGFVSVKKEHEIVHFDKATGAVVWEFGEGRDFELEPGGTWFRDQHSASILPGDHVLLYDNKGSSTARVVEYALDVASGTATEVWSYAGAPGSEWDQNAWGDADRLPNGNTLVTSARDPNFWIREVVPDGAVVWDFTLAAGAQAYRSERIEPPLLIRVP